jgi:uncharacterized coiled-coil protein SlyX
VSDDAARWVEVESRIAFQEREIARLNEALLQQQRRLDRLARLCETLKARLGTGVDADPRAEPPPPHYSRDGDRPASIP